MPNHTQKRRKHLFGSLGGVNCFLGYRLLSFLLLMLLACTRRRHSRHAKPYPKVISERRKHLFGSLGSVNCILGHRLLSFPLLMLLACTAKPYPKVILERRKHLLGSLGECELQHSWSSGASPKPSGSQICSGKSGLPILLQQQISEEQAQARQGVRGLARCGPFVCAEGCALKELRVWLKKQTHYR